MDSVVTIKDLVKIYKQPDGNDLVVLNNLNCSIQKETFTSIIGKSGCGKSTLLNLLGLLDVASSCGTFSIANQDVLSLSQKEKTAFRGKNIGFIFQFHQLLPEFTALDNVMLPMRVNPKFTNLKDRAMELLSSVFSEEEMNSKVYARKPSQLSGGQCQRVAIARSLANDPAIILADEPTGSLDPKSAEIVGDILFDLPNRGKTVIMITHQLDLALRADTVLHMDQGVLTQKSASDFQNTLTQVVCPQCAHEFSVQ